MPFLVLSREQSCSRNDNHEHVEGVFVADEFARECGVRAAVHYPLLEELEAVARVPWLFHIVLVFFNLNLIFLSVFRVEIVERFPEDAVWVAYEHLVVSLLVFC